MNTTTKPRRSGAKIMAQLIVLLGSLVYIMLLAVINGTAGFLCAMGVTLSGAAAIAKALGEEISLSYDALIALAKQPNAIGFLLPAMEKSQLFRGVIADGILPRKTFSMGHSREKRYYLEGRKIK